MEDWQQRLLDEREQLRARLERLNVFINDDPKYKALPVDERVTLVDQSSAMDEYLSILNKRVAKWSKS